MEKEEEVMKGEEQVENEEDWNQEKLGEVTEVWCGVH